ncbi:MAG: hypothetical protein NTZ17_16635 [Phycisphaerae bacterium]|nr:hypothetical protein [Phycisphaerae bacterium]
MVGPDAEVRLTAAAGGSQTIRFERFTFQASSSAGGIDYADLIFLLGMLLGGLAHPVAVIVSMVGIPLATYINAAVESLTKGEVKLQERLSLRFLRIVLLVLGGLSHQTHLAVWLVAATVVYAVASRMIYSLVFLRRWTRQATVSTSARSRNDGSLSV